MHQSKMLSLLLLGMILVACDFSSRQAPQSWPLAPLSQDQLAEVKACDIDELLPQRYPDDVSSDALWTHYGPKTACDWAILAAAYADRSPHGTPSLQSAQEAFAEAVHQNWGFALAKPLFYSYFGSLPLVTAPPFTEQDIIAVEIRYDWIGMGQPQTLVSYTVSISQANTTPQALITSNQEPRYIKALDKGVVQALRSSLSDLVPISSQFTLKPCWDYEPDWFVQLTFQDETTLQMTTHGSNSLLHGGPWQMTIAEQDYMQASPAILNAMEQLMQSLELPLGELLAAACTPEDVIEKAFP